MNILINCSNLRFGGGITVGYNIIKYLKTHRYNDQIILIAPSNCGYERFDGGNTTIHILSSRYNNILLKPFLNKLLLPYLVKKHKADCIISLGNIAIPVNKPQILMIMFPYIAYPESIVWKRLSLLARVQKKKIIETIKNNFKYANVIFVQTETMKQRLAQQYGWIANKIMVAPCAVSFTSKQKNDKVQVQQDQSKKIKLLVLSKYYAHKNFEVLIPLAKEIKKQNLDITITTTLGEKENKGAINFLKEIKINNLQNIIHNVGNIKVEQVSDAYANHDALLLPTLLESFSGTYIESFYFKKPVFTSDLDFAHDACKDAAFFFDPLSFEDILSVIVNAFNHPELIQQKIELGNEYLNEYKTWDETGQMFEKQMELITSF